jgi:hypothetical protein
MGITNRQKSMVLSWSKSIFSGRRVRRRIMRPPSQSLPRLGNCPVGLRAAIRNPLPSSTKLHLLLVCGACPMPAHFADPIRRSCLWPACILCSVYALPSATRPSSNLEPTASSCTHLKPKLNPSFNVLVPTLFPPQPLFPIHAELASLKFKF